MRQALTFDDVYIVPTYSEVTSRSSVDLHSVLTRNTRVLVPIISAPMDSVTGAEMAKELMSHGAAAALYRFCSTEEACEMVRSVAKFRIGDERKLAWTFVPVVASIGAVGDDEKDRAERLVDAGASVLLIDVAHGDHIHVKNMMEWINQQSWRSYVDVILGNIATADAAKRLEDWGADALRVGIGGGSMCTTRVRTGVGVPQFTAIYDVASVATVPVIGDGGIRSSGDVAKALAAGADTVMIGSLFAGTDEAPGEMFVTGEMPNEKKFKIYRGSASMTIKLARKGSADNVEGTATMVPLKGKVGSVVKVITDGVRSAMSYVGANNLTEFRINASFVNVTTAGLIEAQPHGLR
jgi:IMP dehydrogenase